MCSRLINSVKIARNSLQKFAEVRRHRATVAAVDNVESQRMQNLEQKVKEESASKPDGWDYAKPFSEMPGPKPLPIVGNMWRFLPFFGDSIELLTGLRKYGDIVAIRGFLNENMVFVYRPEDIETVYRNEGTWPERLTLRSLDYYQSNFRKDIYDDLHSLITSNGKDWNKMRSMANPIFNQIRSVEMYIPEIDSVAQDFVKRVEFLADYKEDAIMPENFSAELNKWSLESISFIALNKRLGCLENILDPNSEAQRAINALRRSFDLMYKLELRPSFFKYINTRDLNEFVRQFDLIVEIFIKNIKEVKKNMKNSSLEGNQSMLERFLNVNEKVAIIIAIELLAGGVDTTGKAGAALLYLLSTHKRAQDELRKELVSLLPNKDSPLTKETLANAKYLKACIKEGLRMGGFTFANFRTATKDMVVDGYQIPKGTVIQICAYQNMFSEKIFPRPREFIPERWLRTNTSETSHKNVHPFAYRPFGFGARSCIGQRIATMELELLAARIIRNFELMWPHQPAKFAAKLHYEVVDPLRLKVKKLSE